MAHLNCKFQKSSLCQAFINHFNNLKCNYNEKTHEFLHLNAHRHKRHFFYLSFFRHLENQIEESQYNNCSSF